MSGKWAWLTVEPKRITLSAEEFGRVMGELDEPPEEIPALRDLILKHRRLDRRA